MVGSIAKTICHAAPPRNARHRRDRPILARAARGRVPLDCAALACRACRIIASAREFERGHFFPGGCAPQARVSAYADQRFWRLRECLHARGDAPARCETSASPPPPRAAALRVHPRREHPARRCRSSSRTPGSLESPRVKICPGTEVATDMRCTAVDAATVRIASMQMQCVWIATIATLAALVVAEATHTGRGPGAGRALLIAANKLVDRIRGRAALRIIHRRSRAAPAVRWAAECPWRRALRSSAASRTPRGDLPTSHVGWPSGQARHTLHRNRIKNK